MYSWLNRSIASLALMGLLSVAGCDSFDSFQKPPNISAPGTVDNIPRVDSTATTIAAANVAPLPPAMRGSLWRPGSKTFFRDPRARGVGDLLRGEGTLRVGGKADHGPQGVLGRLGNHAVAPEFQIGP